MYKYVHTFRISPPLSSLSFIFLFRWSGFFPPSRWCWVIAVSIFTRVRVFGDVISRKNRLIGPLWGKRGSSACWCKLGDGSRCAVIYKLIFTHARPLTSVAHSLTHRPHRQTARYGRVTANVSEPGFIWTMLYLRWPGVTFSPTPTQK